MPQLLQRFRTAPLVLTLFATLALAPRAESQATRKVLTIEDYARWRSMENSRISVDGNWVVYGFRHPNALDPQPVLHVLRLDSGKDREIPNGTQPAISDDSRWVAYYVEQPYADTKKLRDGNKPVTRKAQLLELSSGSTQTWEDIQSFSFSPGSGHLLLKRRAPDAKAKHKGADVILHDLRSGYDQLLGSVNEALFNPKGELLAYTVDAAEKDANGLFVVDLRNNRVHPLDDDSKNYSRLSWNEAGTALAVIKGLEVEKKAERENLLLAFADVYGLLALPGEAQSALLDTMAAGFPRGYVVSEKRELVWSANGKLVFLGVREQRAALDTTEKKKGTDELPDVDVWNTKDPRIQSVQMARAEADRNFTYRAAFDVAAQKFIPLADSTMREVELTLDGRWGIGRDDRAYISDYQRPSADLYRVNPATGERALMLRGQITNTSTGSHVFGTSPDGKYFLYWRDGQFQLYDLDAGSSTQLTRNGVSFVDQEFDHPGPKPAYGLSSWTKDGKAVVLLHRYDLWLVPLDGGPPTNLTRGVGSKNEIRFRPINTESTEGMGPLQRARATALDLSKPILLSAYGQWTKKSGFYELREGKLTELVYEDALFGSLSKAAQADKFLFTRETFTQFPDLRVAGPSFQDAKQLTDVNPQRAEYAWGRRMLFDFTNKKGVRLQGILAIPDDYKQGERRPMIVTFYEKNSQNLHRYPAPSFLASMGSVPIQAVSQGYLTMLPDVHFNTGTSHSDMLEAVEAATRKVIAMGYADPKHIGVHGHSYGGQGVAFIGTRSRLFAAVGMGAGVTDLSSDFNHNWGWSYQVTGRDGSNGYDYYLFGQGRQGTTPWDNPELYRFESAMTHVREVTAPFLIMHGTADPTVSFQEGLGFYNALRFNGKNAVLLAYPGEGHGLRGLANRRDLTIRYFQYFDHYLRGAPAPRWLSEGVPFLDKDLRRDASKEIKPPQQP
ncbi:MAG TPA: prolyl oligopeptidase family serine peptidase [Gemmatimonadales bacterium]|nr:prolyl oligopeptidase family serine peptidase [Gemmatimonadales bacterium]